MGKAVEPVYTYVAAMRERRAYKYPVPDALEMELGEQRSIFSLWGDEKEKRNRRFLRREQLPAAFSRTRKKLPAVRESRRLEMEHRERKKIHPGTEDKMRTAMEIRKVRRRKMES